MGNRWDETWHRLREWTKGQGPSERLAAQILLSEGYESLDPSHPLGGPDGGKDALCTKAGRKWVMAVYFPRGEQTVGAIKKKLLDDLVGASSNGASAMAFVTNQELSLADRDALRGAAGATEVELYHLDRVTTILDQPGMSGVRSQFLDMDAADTTLVDAIKAELATFQKHLAALQTGGDSFCYWMLYHFDLTMQVAQNFCIIRRGEYPLYGVQIRIM